MALRYMPLLFISLAFLGGILLESELGWSRPVALAVMGISLVLWLFRRHLTHVFSGRVLPAWTQPALPYTLVIVALSLGMLRMSLAIPKFTSRDLAWHNGSGEWVVEGVLQAPPEYQDGLLSLRVKVDRGHLYGVTLFQPLQGILLVAAPPGGDWQYGDRLRLEGALQAPPEFEAFSYRQALARENVYSLMNAWSVTRLGRGQGNPLFGSIYALRDRAWRLLTHQYPEPESSLLSGILLGIESGISQKVQVAFQRTGTAHIIAISGYNMSLLSGLFLLLFTPLLGRWRGLLVAILAMVFYTFLVGAQASVVRAAWMSSFALLGHALGRRGSGVNALAFVAALMALFDPQVLWQVGFQLSVAATLGLVLYADFLQDWLVSGLERRLPAEQARRIARPVGEYILLTLAAQATVLPVIVYHFHRISWISVFTNPFILPIQPLLMLGSGAALLVGLVYAPLGQLLARLAWPFAAYTIRAVEIFDQLPGGEWVLGPVPLIWIILLYAALIVLPLSWPRLAPWLAERRAAWLPSAGMTLLAVLAILAWRSALNAPNGLLSLTLLAGNGGDALLIQSPTGRYMLVNGGASGRYLGDALGRRLPRTAYPIDWLIVASPAEEQIAALPQVVERYLPLDVLWAGAPAGTRAARDLQRTLGSLHIPIHLAQAGQTLDLGAGASLNVLAVGRRGAVLLLEWEHFHALLPIGLDFDLLEVLQTAPPAEGVTALLLADAGSLPLNPPEWISSLQPQVALVSVTAGNPRGLPDPQILAALEGYTLLRTDQNGWIQLSTDGEQLWVEVERR